MKRIALVFEPSAFGHRFQYARVVIDAIAPLHDQVVFATGGRATTTAAYTQFLADCSSFTLDTGNYVNDFAHPMAIAFAKLRALAKAIRRHRPTRVYVPTADGLVLTFGCPMLVRGLVRTQMPDFEFLIMGGHRRFIQRDFISCLKNRMAVRGFSRKCVKRVHVLDPQLLKCYEKLAPAISEKLHLIHEPVEKIPVMSRRDARAKLALPLERNVIGFFGAINHRKGFHLLLDAMQRLRTESITLLAMGRTDGKILHSLTKHESLLLEKKVVVVDRFVSQEELHCGMLASDVICTPYPDHRQSSGILVRAAAARRLVVGPNVGWIGKSVIDHGLGVVCDVTDSADLAKTLLHAVRRRVYRHNAKANEFVHQNSASNVRRLWAAGVLLDK